DSPKNAARLLSWCWDHQDAARYQGLLAPGYAFVAAGIDTPGAAVGAELTRSQELTAAENLFVRGMGDRPPARRITLDANSDLIALPDLRAGMEGESHRVIYTSYTLTVDTDAQA